jgi:futalosine hydrolase
MNVLLVAATPEEISFLHLPLILGLNQVSNKKNLEILISGVGIMATTFHLTEALNQKKYNLVINAGIAGSFSREIKIGEVVEVTSEIIGDLGAEDDGVFLDIFDLQLSEKNIFPFHDGMLQNNNPYASQFLSSLKKTKGLTVNKVHGNASSIDKIKRKYQVDVESMEGAACFYVCKQKNIPCVQLRSISNYIEKRNRADWNIALAIKNLNQAIEGFLDEMGC